MYSRNRYEVRSSIKNHIRASTEGSKNGDTSGYVVWRQALLVLHRNMPNLPQS